MSFGLSPSDIGNLAKLCYDVYHFCRTTPAHLQDVLDRIESIGHKLQRLSFILDRSGLGTWNGAPSLKQSLADARKLLEPYVSGVAKQAAVALKAKRLAQLALNPDKVKAIKRTLDLHEKMIDDFKIDLILSCSLRNLQQSRHSFSSQSFEYLSSRARSSTESSIQYIQDVGPGESLSDLQDDRASITSSTMSEAGKALVAMWSINQQSSHRSCPPPTQFGSKVVAEHNPLEMNVLINDVVDLAEESNLYAHDVDPASKLEHLAKITGMVSSSSFSSPSLRSNTASDSGKSRSSVLNESDFSILSQKVLNSENDSVNTQDQPLDGDQQVMSELEGASAISPSAQTPICPENPLTVGSSVTSCSRIEDGAAPPIVSVADRTLHSESITSYLTSLKGRSRVSLSTNANMSAQCAFTMVQTTEKVTLLRLKLISNSGTTVPHVADANSAGLYMPGQDDRSSDNILEHYFPTHDRPIPHLLHSCVEGATRSPDAPYTITFSELQHVSIADAAQKRQELSSLMYVFDESEDRHKVCETLFGKTLLMVADSNKVICGGKEVSHMAAVLLWYNGREKRQSLTFNPNLVGRRSRSKDVELQIESLWTKDRTWQSPDVVTLVVLISQTQSKRPFLSPSLPHRIQERGHSQSARNSISEKPSDRVEPKRMKCVIEFTENHMAASFARHISDG